MKKSQPITKERWAMIVAVSGICFLSVLTGKQQQPISGGKDNPSGITEKTEKDVEHGSENDSDQEESNQEATAFMIGLPF
ncbi:hypothetical protein ACT29H_02820 [Thermophagus sp. OGC60D27]|uniref:hypothetical protein n=1 Tax=Thermophagus sp. OGC60D27 TaxID=3458415 RepID=UPI004038074B